MITGEVSAGREPIVRITIKNPHGIEQTLDAVIDTGFTEYLTLPPDVISALSLPAVNTIRVYLAGNVEAVVDMHPVTVEWDGQEREILAFKADGMPLIGMGMLRGFRLCLDGVDGGPVTISRQ